MENSHSYQIIEKGRSKIHMNNFLRSGLGITAALIFAGCGGGGGGSASGTTRGTGHYLDSGVKGVHYECGAFSGETRTDGGFDLEEGKSCRFSLNGLLLREVDGSRIFDGVYILEDDLRVARTLQTLDIDGDADNGIVIPASALGCLGDSLPADDDDFRALADCLDQNLSDYNGAAVDADDARDHLEETREANTPRAEAITVEGDEDRPLTVTLRGSDPQGDPLRYSVVEEPEHGTLSGSAPNLTYTPEANWYGTDTFRFRVSDGSFESNLTTVTLIVRSVNDLPTAVDDRVTMEEDGNLSINVLENDHDVDGGTLSITAVTTPVHGTATISGEAIRYIPQRNYHGSDSFRYTVSDGQGGSAEATVTVEITSVNDAPAADDLNVSTSEDRSVEISLSASDVDGDTLQYTLLSQPQHGELSGNAPRLTYTPDPDWYGTETFQYRADDGTLSSNIATVTILVTEVNDAPVAQNLEFNVTEGSSITFDLNGSDVENDPLSFRILSDPSHGTLSGTPPHLTYTPANGYVGEDSFTYVVNDGSTDSSPATVTLTIESNGSTSGEENVTVSGTVTYDLIPPKSDYQGLDFDNIASASAKKVIVQALDESDNLLAETATDENGSYHLSLAKNTRVKIRVLAKMYRDGTPSWDVKVVDNTNDGALYVMEGDLTDTGTSDSIRDLHAPSGWNGDSYSSPRVAAPFAILDSINAALDKILEANSSTHFPALIVNWSPNNKATSGDKTEGEIGTSHYTDGNLYILGDASANGDTDEYDNHVITHEWGHYYEDKFSRSDSIGGGHSGGDYLDIRVAFGEGWGNAFSAISLDDPHYYDTFFDSAGESIGWSMDIESGSPNNPGWFSESSIQRIIYDLYDGNPEGADQVNLGFGPIHHVFVDAEKNTPAFTSIFTFITYLKAQNASVAEDIDTVVSNENIATIEDIYGRGRTNHSDDYPYHFLDIDGNVSVTTTNEYGTYNKLGNRKYVSFTIDSAGNYTIRIAQNNGTDADPDFKLYRSDANGLSYIGRGENEGSVETDTFSLSTGEYLIDLYDYENIEQAVFDVTVSQ
jgi:hypothetical protein